MKREEQLDILKMDLQLMTDIRDEYLRKLLELSEGEIRREGIKLDDSVESGMVQVHYAAWLFRKRAANVNETGMPRFLRYELNKRLMSQVMGGKKNDI